MQWLFVRCSWKIFIKKFKKIFYTKEGITAAKEEDPTMHRKISSKLTIMTQEWFPLCRSGVFVVNCIFHTFSNVPIADFEQVKVCYVACMSIKWCFYKQ